MFLKVKSSCWLPCCLNPLDVFWIVLFSWAGIDISKQSIKTIKKRELKFRDFPGMGASSTEFENSFLRGVFPDGKIGGLSAIILGIYYLSSGVLILIIAVAITISAITGCI